ncbi:MAG TPA: VWA domain-containing protein [Blastocatellia bacterium]|nr:VWA domain-containing protein [Blastocatellia bacterium]
MRATAIALVMVVGLVMAGQATVFSPPQTQVEPQIKLQTVLINVPVVVYDKKTGEVYQNLGPQNFQIFEDKVRQEITNFSPISDGVNVVLTLENNRRLREINRGDYQPLFDEVLAAASTFVGQFMRKGDYVAIVSYHMRPKVEADFTDNAGQLRLAISRMGRDILSFSESNLYDALVFVLTGGKDDEGNEYKGLVEVEGRTAVVLVATGFDTFSRATLDEALRIIERVGVPVYTVGIGNLFYKRYEPWLSSRASVDFLLAFNTLRSIAERSGGRHFPVTFESELAATISTISALLHSQYSLAYTPSNLRTEGKKRKIEVLVDVDEDGTPDNDRLVVQYRESYREPKRGEGWGSLRWQRRNEDGDA